MFWASLLIVSYKPVDYKIKRVQYYIDRQALQKYNLGIHKLEAWAVEPGRLGGCSFPRFIANVL